MDEYRKDLEGSGVGPERGGKGWVAGCRDGRRTRRRGGQIVVEVHYQMMRTWWT